MNQKQMQSWSVEFEGDDTPTYFVCSSFSELAEHLRGDKRGPVVKLECEGEVTVLLREESP